MVTPNLPLVLNRSWCRSKHNTIPNSTRTAKVADVFIFLQIVCQVQYFSAGHKIVFYKLLKSKHSAFHADEDKTRKLNKKEDKVSVEARAYNEAFVRECRCTVLVLYGLVTLSCAASIVCSSHIIITLNTFPPYYIPLFHLICSSQVRQFTITHQVYRNSDL